MRPRLRFLSDELIERILDEAYKLLETKGVTLHHESLPRRLADAGCLLDADGKRARMPREVVEAAVRSAPSRIELWNIAGDGSSDLSGDNVHFTPGSTAIKMLITSKAACRFRSSSSTPRSATSPAGSRRALSHVRTSPPNLGSA